MHNAVQKVLQFEQFAEEMLLLSVTLLLLILMHFAPNLTAAIQEFPFAQNEVGAKKKEGLKI